MKNVLLASLISLGVTGCFGYNPLYHSIQSTFSDVKVEKVEMDVVEYRSTDRRSAQMLAQRLSQTFTGENTQDYFVSVLLTEEKNTLAVARDASDERLELSIWATVKLKDTQDQVVFQTRVEASAPYNIEDSPYATESGKERARLSAINVLSDEIVHRLSFYFYNQEKAKG